MSRVIMPASIGWGIVFEKATKEALEQALCVKGVHMAFYPTSNLSMSYKKGGEERASSYTQGKSRREERGLKLSAKVRVEGRRGEGLQASTQGQSRIEERRGDSTKSQCQKRREERRDLKLAHTVRVELALCTGNPLGILPTPLFVVPDVLTAPLTVESSEFQCSVFKLHPASLNLLFPPTKLQ